MRKLQWILSLCLLSPSFWGQGYGRVVGKDFARGITRLEPLENGAFRLRFYDVYNGPGPDNGNDSYAVYDPIKDSLGLHHRATQWGALYDKNRFEYEIARDKIWISRQECCAEGSRQGISFRFIDLNRPMVLPEQHLAFQSGSFDPVFINDTAYLLRSVDSIFQLTNRNYQKNSKKILCYYAAGLDSLVPLDTLEFGVDFKAPGTLFYDSATSQFELLYDSLQFFFQFGSRSPQLVQTHYGSFWHHSDYLWEANLARNRYLQNDSCWEVYDTLGYDWVKLCKDRYGKLELTVPWQYEPFKENYRLYPLHDQGNHVASSVAVNEADSTCYLLRYENDSLVQALFLPSLPHDIGIYDYYSNDDGSFYLVGSAPHRYLFTNDYTIDDSPLFVKVDAKGKFRKSLKEPTLEMYHYGYMPILMPFLEQPFLRYEYRIIGPSGRVFKKGTFRGRDGINTSGVRDGLYILQLWYAHNGEYLGQGKFIKP